MMEVSTMKKIGLFLGGVCFGTAGVKILFSKEAKKIYTQSTAAALRIRECILKTTTKIQENAEDIVAEAKEMNRQRAGEEMAETAPLSEKEEEGRKREIYY